jgi:hypothetical protein
MPLPGTQRCLPAPSPHLRSLQRRFFLVTAVAKVAGALGDLGSGPGRVPTSWAIFDWPLSKG